MENKCFRICQRNSNCTSNVGDYSNSCLWNCFGDKANIRVVDSYYKENAFYITTYLLSNKMKEILKNPNVALNHNLFVAHGIGENIGNPLDEPNRGLREELKSVFVAFYDKHVDEQDENTCILKISLNDAIVI
ncbi:MAG TPA: pyridoxamine 5'-phosphate oxidase family protein [Clostridia bacterium]|nr:pyridoxamine 5'-phosphate oxidase family protein [Clostridia bacterium]